MHPQPGEDRRERDDEERVRRLEPAAGEAPAQDGVPGGAIGEEIERRSRLLELGPEQGSRQKEDADRVEPLPLARRPVPAKEQPGKEHDRRHEEQIAGRVGNLPRRDREHACIQQPAKRRETNRRHTTPQRCPLPQRRRLRLRLRRGRMQACLAQIPGAKDVLDQSERHAHTGSGEPACQFTRCPRYPHTSGEKNAPRLMPM